MRHAFATACGHGWYAFPGEKGEQNGRTFTKVVELDREARKAEIARITGGSQVTDALLASAADILDQAAAYRAQLRER